MRALYRGYLKTYSCEKILATLLTRPYIYGFPFLMLFLSKLVLSGEINYIILIFQAKLHVFPQYLLNCMAKNFFTLQQLQSWGKTIEVDVVMFDYE